MNQKAQAARDKAQVSYNLKSLHRLGLVFLVP